MDPSAVPTIILAAIALALFGCAGWWLARRAARGQQAKHDEMLALMESAAQSGAWRDDLVRKVSTWSPGMYRVFGIDPSRGMPRPLDQVEFFEAQAGESLAQVYATVREAGGNHDFETRLRRADGTACDVRIAMQGRSDALGHVVEIAGVITDVTPLKTAERGIADRDEQIQRALSASRAAAWDWDLENGVFYVSSRLGEMVDLPRDPWSPSRELHDNLCHPEDRARVERAMKSHAETGAPLDLEYRLRRSDGTDIWVQNKGRAVMLRDGKPIRSIGSLMDVTLRHEMDAALAQKQEMLELVVDAAQAGYFEQRFDTGEVTWSNRLRQILGIPADRPARMEHIYERIYPEDLPDFLLALDMFLRAADPLDLELRVRHEQGHYIWLHLRVVQHVDATGRRLRTVGFVLEVSDRVEARRALADSERKFRNLVEASIQGVVIHRRYRPLFCNPAYARLLGYDSAEEVLALPSLVIHLSPEDAEDADAFWEHATAGELDGKVSRRRMIHRSGRELWFETVGRMTQWEGEPAWLMAAIEITEQKRVEDELRASEERFRFIADNASDLLIHYDDTGKMLYVSPSSERITGYTYEEAAVRGVFATVHPDDVEALRARRSPGNGRAPQGGTAQWRNRHKDGRWIWMESHATVIPMPDGRYQILAAVRDVSERVQREAEIHAARDRLQQQTNELAVLAQNLERERLRAEQASLAKSQFLAMMSHELRTPLTGVIGMADLLLLSNLTEEQAGVTRLLVRSARVLLDLLNDVLDFSKIEAGQLEIESIPFSIVGVSTEVGDLYGTALADKNLKYDVRIGPNVRDAVIGDPKRLRQVLSNLISNATKFTHQGGITVSVDMETVNGGELLARFAVADTGMGIAAEDIAKLFRPFVQADLSTSRRYGGSGLGLAICRRLVNAMGGEITLESTPGKGSTFTFSIRLLPAASVPDADAEPTAPALSARARTLDILVVEDNETTRYLLGAVLERLGHRVTPAEDGKVALDVYAKQTFDIVLMDMQMPVMDGVEATRRIRELPGDRGHVPIIALTADAIPEHHPGFLAAGANAVVVKPVVWRELGAVIDHLVPGASVAESVDRGQSGSRSQEVAVRGSQAPTDAMPVLDEAALGDLIATLGEQAVANMLPTFVSNMVEYRDRLARAIAEADMVAAKRAAHAMKGLAAQFGAPRVSMLARLIEDEAHSVADVSKTLGKLVNAVAEAAQAIKAREKAQEVAVAAPK